MSFEGFSKQSTDFLSRLAAHNDRAWFSANRDLYEAHIVAPSEAFVVAMGERLQKIAPGIHADPRPNRSIFRMYRDVRFSENKDPFKTHVGIWLWEGAEQKMESSGFYFQLHEDKILLAVGMYQFPKALLPAYRESVAHKRHGQELARIMKKVEQIEGIKIDGSALKSVPRGYDKKHLRARWLRHKGLSVSLELPIPESMDSPEFLDFCMEHYARLAPVHVWLRRLLKRVAKESLEQEA